MNNSSSPLPELVPISRAAEILGVSIDTVRRWEKKGKLKAERSEGGHRLFSVKELTKLKSNQPLTISQAAQELGISPSTLRRYEQQGKIIPNRNKRGERIYTQDIINGFQNGESSPSHEGELEGVSESSSEKTSSDLKEAKNKNYQAQIPNDQSNPNAESSNNEDWALGIGHWALDEESTPPQGPQPQSEPTIYNQSPATSKDPLFIPTSTSEAITDKYGIKDLEVEAPIAAPISNYQGEYPSAGKGRLRLIGRTVMAAMLLMGAIGLFRNDTLHYALLSNGQNGIGTSYDDAPLAQGPTDGRVLAVTTEDLEQFFEVNIPAVFHEEVRISNLTVEDLLEINGEVDALGVDIDLGTGTITASNLVYSVQGQTGNVAFQAGEGIAIEGTTIVNTAPGTAQNTFGSVQVGTGTIAADSPTDSFELAAGSNVSLALDTATNKITISSTDTNTEPIVYTAGSDLELSGNEFSVSSTLEGVDTINGLTTLDATSENTIEAAIFDTDAETITGAWTVDDNVALGFGAGDDWTITYDEATGDRLLIQTTNTASASTTDPLLEILVGTTPSADQQVFGIAKGTAGSNTSLFSVDEDGDTIIGGTITLGGETYTWPASQGGNDHVLTTNGAGVLEWSSPADAGIIADITAVGTCESGGCFIDNYDYPNDLATDLQFIFEGATVDANEIRLQAHVDPTGDRVITLPDLSGTVILSGHTLGGDLSGTVGASNSTTVTVESIRGVDFGATSLSAASGRLLVGDGDSFESVALSNDATLAANGALTIADNAITEQMLSADNTPTDEYCLTYESASGNFEWTSCDAAANMQSFDITDGTTTDTVDNTDNTVTFSDDDIVVVAVSATNTVDFSIAADSIDGAQLADAITLDGLTLSFDDGVNTLLTLTDGGSTGNLDVTGSLTLGTALAVAEGGTGATTLNDLITLGTHTTGNFVDNVTGGNGIAVSGTAGEGWEPALAIDLLTTADGVGVSSSVSGLEFSGASSDKLGLIQGCADQQLLKWNDTTGEWFCASGSGTSAFDIKDDANNTQTIQDSDQILFSNGTSIDFTVSATDTVTADVIDNSIDGSELADAITLDTGSLLFDDGTTNFFAIVDNGTQGEIRLYEDSGSGANYISLKTPATLAGDVNLTLPPDDGESDYVLVTNGSGVLTWQDPTSVGSAGDISAVGTCSVGQCFVDGNTTDYQLIFEGATDDAFEITLAAADATSDTTITLPNLTGTVILSGHEFTAGGDVTGTLEADGTTVLTIENDAVALTTQTTGNYVAVVNTTGSLTGGSAGSEGATLTLDVLDDSINGTELADSLSVEDGTLLDLSAIIHDDAAAQGLKLPQTTSLTAITGGGEGYLAWDTDDDQLKVYDGAAWQDVATGVSTAWDDISDPDADQTLNMVEYATVFDWNTDTGSAFDAFTYNITNDVASANTQRLMVLTNADDGVSTDGTTENLLTLSNLDTNESVATAIIIDSAAGGIATAIDLSDPEIVTALALGDNPITGDQATINFTNFDVDASGNIVAAGDIAINGDDITSDGALTINAASYVRVGDTATPGSASGDDDLFVEGDLEIDGIAYLDGDAIFANDTLLDLSAITHNDSAAQGLKLPQNTALTALSGAGEGFLAWDTDDDQVKVFNGTAWVDIATGLSTAWDDIGDPDASSAINMAEFTTDFLWTTDSTGEVADYFTFNVTNNATTDNGAQRLLVLENADDGAATGTTDRLLVLNNLDTNEAVTTALEIISEAGTIGTAIDVSDPEITTALNIGANEIAGTTGTINFNNFDVDASGNLTAAGDLTIQGDDLFLTTNTDGFILVADGTNFNPVDASGDIDISNTGLVTIQNDAVALATDTTGDFVATITGGTGLASSGATTGENISHTLSFDCSEVEGTDIDCVGEAITLETTLDSVTTINGLTTVDATTEDTIEGTIFDTDAANIPGVWEVQDDTNFAFGNDANWTFEYDEATDDQLLLTTTNTGATATTDPLFEILVPASPTADQQLFGLAKGTQASNTPLFTIDEDGDLFTAGTTTFNTVAYTWPAADGVDNAVLTTDSNGQLAWETLTGAGAGGDITSVGDCTTDACFDGTASSGTFLTFENGEQINNTTDGTIAFTDGTNSLFAIVDGGTKGEIRLYEDTINGSNYTSFTAPSTLGSNIAYTLPSDTPGADEVLTTDASGNLRWETVSGIGAGDGDIKTVGDCTSGDCFTADGTGNSLSFEGSTVDAVETILTAADPTTSDKTITLPNRTGTVILSGDTFSGDITATLEDDGDTALSITADVVDGTELADNITLDAGLTFTQEASTHTITINNNSGGTLADSLIISGVTAITDAIDLSDNDIENALNIGANNIVFSTGSLSATDLELIDDGTITLTDETTGNYVASVATTGSLTGGAAGSEGATLTLDVADDSINGTELADSIALEDTIGLTFTDGTNTLLTLTDAGTTGNLSITGGLTVPGTTTFNGVTYTWPGADGSADQILSTNGSGTLSWVDSGGSMTSFTLAGDTGPSQTISDSNTLSILTDGHLTATASATDTVTLSLDDDTVGGTELSDTLTLEDGTFLDLSAITHDDSAAQGIKLPQNTTLTALSGAGEGYLAWDTDDDQVKVFNGSAWVDIATGISTAWDDLGDPDANLQLNMSEFTTDFVWNTDTTGEVADYFTFNITNDATTDNGAQRLLVLENADDGAVTTGTTERLLVLNNLDTNEAVTTALEIISEAGTIGTAIDVSDADITTALNIGANDIAFSTGSLSATDLEIIDDGSIDTSEITDDSLLEIDLDATNAPTNGHILSYDETSGGFTWVADDSGGSMTSFDVSGDSGTDQTISDSNVLEIAGGLGLLTTASATDTITIDFDTSAALTGDHALTANQAQFGASGLIFEGATANTAETYLAITDPTADRTITFPDATGEVSVLGQTITLTTETEGNYVASVQTTGSLTGGAAGSEGATLTLDVADDSIDGTELADSITLDADLNIDSDTLVIDATNDRVGIGTAGPDTALHVSGGGVLRLSDAGETNYVDISGSLGYLNVKPTNGTGPYGLIVRNEGTDHFAHIGATSLHASLSFGGSTGSSHLVLESGGDVGIGDTTPDAALDISDDTAATNSVTDILIIEHTSSGTVAAGFGAGLAFHLEDAGGSEEQASIDTILTNVTDLSEVSDIVFSVQQSGAITELARLDGSADTLDVSGNITADGTIGVNVDSNANNLFNTAAGSATTDDLYFGDDLVCDVSETNCGWTTASSAFSSFTISDGTNTTAIVDSDTYTVTGGDSITYTVTQDGDAAAIDVTDDSIGTAELADTLTLGAENLDINVDSTGVFALQASGSDVFTVANTGVMTFSDDVDYSLDASENVTLTKTAAATSDYFVITDGGTGTQTTGIDGASITFTQGADGSDLTDIANNALNIAATASGEAGDTLTGINIAGISATDSTEYGLVIGTGWDKGMLVQSAAEFTAGFTFSGDGRPTRQVTLSPEYEGASLTGDGSSNTGTMTSDFCAASTGVGDITGVNTSVCNTAGDLHSYYNWTTAEGTAQDYDIFIRYRVPDNFAEWAASPIDVFGKRTDATNNAVTVFVYDTAGTLENAGGTQVAGTAWTSTTVESAFAGTYTPGSYMTIRIQMTADTGGDSVQVGEINLDYLTNN